MKKCTKCKELKSKINFCKRKASKDGLNLWCKTCHVDNNATWQKLNPNKVKKSRNTHYYKYPEKVHNKELKYKYGITVDEYNIMLSNQNNKCKICNNEELTKGRSGKVRKMAVDHCHKTNKVRGLLCAKCNQGIGLLNDDIEVLKQAIKYLEEKK